MICNYPDDEEEEPEVGVFVGSVEEFMDLMFDKERRYIADCLYKATENHFESPPEENEKEAKDDFIHELYSIFYGQ